MVQLPIASQGHHEQVSAATFVGLQKMATAVSLDLENQVQLCSDLGQSVLVALLAVSAVFQSLGNKPLPGEHAPETMDTARGIITGAPGR